MAIKEQDKVFYEELANGDKVINLPVTRANNVEGIGRSANTAYVVGDVVYVDNNKKVALKCTTAGTTSSSELDVSSKAVGNTVTDGGVVWQVCNRTSDVTSVNGKTGDAVVGEVKDLSISGTTITVTFADGTTKTLTTQDTIGSDGTVSIKLSTTGTIPESSSTTKSITGLTVNKPLFIYIKNTSSNAIKDWCISSGIATTSLNNGQYSSINAGYAVGCVVIPTSTSVVVKLDAYGYSIPFSLYAYQ